MRCNLIAALAALPVAAVTAAGPSRADLSQDVQVMELFDRDGVPLDDHAEIPAFGQHVCALVRAGYSASAIAKTVAAERGFNQRLPATLLTMPATSTAQTTSKESTHYAYQRIRPERAGPDDA
jgi:Protein of unknown function (DUF732)